MGSTTTTFTVTGMSCAHCVAAVTEEVSKLENVTRVDVDLPSGGVTVESDGPVDPDAFAAAVAEAGYAMAQQRCGGAAGRADRVQRTRISIEEPPDAGDGDGVRRFVR